MKKRIAVLISGGGTNLQAIIDAIESGYIENAEIAAVVSNRENAYGIKRANNHNIPYTVVLRRNYKDNNEFNQYIIDYLEEQRIDIVVLAGYLSILNENFISCYRNRIINIHPSLIPMFCGKGYYGSKVHKAVIDYGVKVTGVTVHFVDEGTDTGAIILQEPVLVEDEDTPETLAKRVLKTEHTLIVQAVKLLTDGRLIINGRKVTVDNIM